MRATVRVRMATDKGVAAGLAWDDMSDGVCQAATLSVAIRGQQNFRQAGHGIGFGVISATPLLVAPRICADCAVGGAVAAFHLIIPFPG
jgi:hypothetical protein